MSTLAAPAPRHFSPCVTTVPFRTCIPLPLSGSTWRARPVFLPVFHSLAERLISKVLSKYLDSYNQPSLSSYYVRGTVVMNNIRGSLPTGSFGFNGGGWMHVDSGTPDHHQYGTSWSCPGLLGVPVSVPLHMLFPLPVVPSLPRLRSPHAGAGGQIPAVSPCAVTPLHFENPIEAEF